MGELYVFSLGLSTSTLECFARVRFNCSHHHVRVQVCLCVLASSVHTSQSRASTLDRYESESPIASLELDCRAREVESVVVRPALSVWYFYVFILVDQCLHQYTDLGRCWPRTRQLDCRWLVAMELQLGYE